MSAVGLVAAKPGSVVVQAEIKTPMLAAVSSLIAVLAFTDTLPAASPIRRECHINRRKTWPAQS